MEIAALLRCWAVEVTLGDNTYEIPAMPAADWVEAIASRDALAVIPGLLDEEDEQEIDEALAFGDLDDADVVTAVRDVVEAAAGRPWWEVYRLVLAAVEQADTVFGYLAERGFDFSQQSLGAFCAAVYSIATRNMEKKDRLKFDMTLKAVPADVLAADEEALTEAFVQAMGERSGR